MEQNLQKSPQLSYPLDIGDSKYVSGLSTILVATIQEAKDRISQIEYIFCSQLFPNFQSQSKSSQKVYSEATKAAEEAWKKKEKYLLLAIENLQHEKKLILEENRSLKLENSKFAHRDDLFPKKIYELQEELKQPFKEEEEEELKQRTSEVAEGGKIQVNLLEALEAKSAVPMNMEKIVEELVEKNNLLLKKQRGLELENLKVRRELLRKLKEVDEGMELQNKLLQLVQAKATLILQKEKELKEQEEKTNVLLAKLESLEKDVYVIQEKLSAKTDEVEKEKELCEKLLKENESHLLSNVTNEQLLNTYVTENKSLTVKLQKLEESLEGLQKELKRRAEELVEGGKLQEQLLRQIDLNNSEMLKNGQRVEVLEEEKRLLLTKIKGLEEKVDKLNVDLRQKNYETSEGMELHGKLLQQIETKDSALFSEKKKRRDVISAYKSLKSQYNFLRAKCGLTPEIMLPLSKIEDESDSLSCNPNPLTSPDKGNIALNAVMVSCEITKEKENLEDDKGMGLIQRSSSSSPCTSSDVKRGTLAGTKRPGSSWRETRSHQKRGGPDPLDDFLDTPLENIRRNMKKPMKEEEVNLPGPLPKDTNFDCSDDETQDVNEDPGRQKPQMSEGLRGFKFVEPVRKKAERENLKGIECKQCKKFFDAVLPDDGGNKQQLRCEHHDGVSRHRYRYAPPLTPEGFWNIGFESEM